MHWAHWGCSEFWLLPQILYGSEGNLLLFDLRLRGCNWKLKVLKISRVFCGSVSNLALSHFPGLVEIFVVRGLFTVLSCCSVHQGPMKNFLILNWTAEEIVFIHFSRQARCLVLEQQEYFRTKQSISILLLLGADISPRIETISGREFLWRSKW